LKNLLHPRILDHGSPMFLYDGGDTRQLGISPMFLYDGGDTRQLGIK